MRAYAKRGPRTSRAWACFACCAILACMPSVLKKEHYNMIDPLSALGGSAVGIGGTAIGYMMGQNSRPGNPLCNACSGFITDAGKGFHQMGEGFGELLKGCGLGASKGFDQLGKGVGELLGGLGRLADSAGEGAGELLKGLGQGVSGSGAGMARMGSAKLEEARFKGRLKGQQLENQRLAQEQNHKTRQLATGASTVVSIALGIVYGMLRAQNERQQHELALNAQENSAQNERQKYSLELASVISLVLLLAFFGILLFLHCRRIWQMRFELLRQQHYNRQFALESEQVGLDIQRTPAQALSLTNWGQPTEANINHMFPPQSNGVCSSFTSSLSNTNANDTSPASKDDGWEAVEPADCVAQSSCEHPTSNTLSLRISSSLAPLTAEQGKPSRKGHRQRSRQKKFRQSIPATASDW